MRSRIAWAASHAHDCMGDRLSSACQVAEDCGLFGVFGGGCTADPRVSGQVMQVEVPRGSVATKFPTERFRRWPSLRCAGVLGAGGAGVAAGSLLLRRASLPIGGFSEDHDLLAALLLLLLEAVHRNIGLGPCAMSGSAARSALGVPPSIPRHLRSGG